MGRFRTVTVVLLSVAGTAIAIALGMNFAVPEKQLERRVVHR